MPPNELSDLIIEANYFEMSYLIQLCKENLREIKFVKVESNGIYSSCPLTAGVVLEELLRKRDNGGDGIATNSPGTITIELNRIITLNKIEIRGYAKNPSYYSNTNGAGAKIQTSTDKKKWTDVGTIPSNLNGEISEVSLTSSKAKYIKFEHTSYLGLSYCNVPKNKN
jgi:hypothetical protein